MGERNSVGGHTVQTYTYKTQGTCSRGITFDLEDNVVRNVSFYGGCAGNLKAISILVDGMTVEELVEKLKGNTCGGKATSCADQLACAVEAALAKSREE